jgi:heptosyltransferase-2
LLELLPICDNAAFIVGNDTGTAHLASATGNAMAVICGPTDPRRVKPLGDNVQAVQAQLACINCYRKHCAHHACMAQVSPQEVYSLLRSIRL